MIVNPPKFEKEWRQVLSAMIDFQQFKQAFSYRHYELVGQIQEGQEILARQTAALTQQIDRKCANEKLKVEVAEKESRLQFDLEEARIALDQELSQLR